MKAEAAPVSGVAIGVWSCASAACGLVQRARATRLVASDFEREWRMVESDRFVFGL